MSDTATATVRTAVPAAWATAAVWIAARLGLDLSEADWQALFLAMPVVIGIVYRALRMAEARWPRAGWILFGSSRTPSYGAAEPEA